MVRAKWNRKEERFWTSWWQRWTSMGFESTRNKPTKLTILRLNNSDNSSDWKLSRNASASHIGNSDDESPLGHRKISINRTLCSRHRCHSPNSSSWQYNWELSVEVEKNALLFGWIKMFLENQLTNRSHCWMPQNGIDLHFEDIINFDDT
jgi:hypothetical protein